MSGRNPCFLHVFGVKNVFLLVFGLKMRVVIHVRLCEVEMGVFCLFRVEMRVFMLQKIDLVMSGKNVCFLLVLGPKMRLFSSPLLFGQKWMFCLFLGRNACFASFGAEMRVFACFWQKCLFYAFEVSLGYVGWKCEIFP